MVKRKVKAGEYDLDPSWREPLLLQGARAQTRNQAPSPTNLVDPRVHDARVGPVVAHRVVV